MPIADSRFIAVALLVTLTISVPASPGSTTDTVGAPSNGGYSYFSFSGIFQLTFPNGTNKAFNSNIIGPTGIILNQSAKEASGNSYDVTLAATFQLGKIHVSPDESFELNVSNSMFLTHNGSSLGFFYLWLPATYANNSQVQDYLTVTGTNNDIYNLSANVIQSGGFDYFLVSSENPYISLVNVYNASTGAGVLLMLPGRPSLTTRMIESGNFTLGHKDIAYVPLGTLLSLNWFDFEPTWAGAWVSPQYNSRVSEFLRIVVPFMQQQNASNQITGWSGIQAEYLGPAVLSVGIVIAALLTRMYLKRDEIRRRKTSEK